MKLWSETVKLCNRITKLWGELWNWYCETLKTDHETSKLQVSIQVPSVKNPTSKFHNPTFKTPYHSSCCPCEHSRSIWSSIGDHLTVDIPSQFEVSWGWEFSYHLTLVDNPCQFEVPLGWEFWYHLTLCAHYVSIWSWVGIGILYHLTLLDIPIRFEVPFFWKFWYHLTADVPRQFEVPWGWEFWYHLTVDNPSQFGAQCGWKLWYHLAVDIPSQFEVPRGWAFWYHLTVDTPSQFEVPWGGNFDIILVILLSTFQVNLKLHRGGNFKEFSYHLTLVDNPCQFEVPWGLELFGGTVAAELRNPATGVAQAELNNPGNRAICQKPLRNQSCAILQVAPSELRNPAKELRNRSCAIRGSFGIGLDSNRDLESTRRRRPGNVTSHRRYPLHGKLTICELVNHHL